MVSDVFTAIDRGCAYKLDPFIRSTNCWNIFESEA